MVIQPAVPAIIEDGMDLHFPSDVTKLSKKADGATLYHLYIYLQISSRATSLICRTTWCCSSIDASWFFLYKCACGQRTTTRIFSKIDIINIEFFSQQPHTYIDKEVHIPILSIINPILKWFSSDSFYWRYASNSQKYCAHSTFIPILPSNVASVF